MARHLGTLMIAFLMSNLNMKSYIILSERHPDISVGRRDRVNLNYVYTLTFMVNLCFVENIFLISLIERREANDAAQIC